jgi:hypothetical protein
MSAVPARGVFFASPTDEAEALAAPGTWSTL